MQIVSHTPHTHPASTQTVPCPQETRTIQIRRQQAQQRAGGKIQTGRRQTQGESECGLAAAKEIVRSQMPAAVCTIRTGVRRFRPGIREHPQRRDLLTLPVIAIFISLKC